MPIMVNAKSQSNQIKFIEQTFNVLIEIKRNSKKLRFLNRQQLTNDSCEEYCYAAVKQIYKHAAAYHNTAWLLTGGKMSCRQ